MSNKKNLAADNFGSRLKQYRVDKGWTGTQLAETIGISQGSLSEIENGKREPSGKFFHGIAKNTDIDIKWLLTGESPKKLAKLPKSKKFEILEEFEEWLGEEIRMDPKRKDWFEIQLLDSFSAFREWKQKRAEEEGGGFDFPASKVA